MKALRFMGFTIMKLHTALMLPWQKVSGKECDIEASGFGPFNTAANRYTSVYRNLDLRQTEKRDSRLIQLSFSYLFGRRTVKGARKRVTGSEGEQGRIGN